MARRTYKKEVLGETWYMTDYPRIQFDASPMGELKRKVWEASPQEIDRILEKYDLPSPSELGKANTYLQNTPRRLAQEKRSKNDVVLIPMGRTGNYGNHCCSGLDTYMASQICEGVRRYTAKKGCEVTLALPPINYSGYRGESGRAGTYQLSEANVRETSIAMLLGLWEDGYRKFILVNNHGSKTILDSVVEAFFKEYQRPAIVCEVEWHRAIQEFWVPIDEPDSLTTHFIRPEEADMAVANLLFPEMMDMSQCEGEENFLENAAVKAKRPVAAICQYITYMVEDMLAHYPVGTAPSQGYATHPVEEVADCFKEPLSEGWVSVHDIPKHGLFFDGNL